MATVNNSDPVLSDHRSTQLTSCEAAWTGERDVTLQWMEPGENYWSVLDPIWNKTNIDTPETFTQTFGDVSRSEGLLYAAHFCQSEACNGGFTQFFWNSTDVLASEAVDGFIAIGRPQVADVLQRAMNMLGSPYRRDRAVRWSALDTLRDEHDKQRDPRDRANYKNMDSFSKLERKFYSLHASEAGGFENAADVYAKRLSVWR
jgi:hypothetical protein